MKILRLALRPALFAGACASIAACANTPTGHTDMDYRSRPPSTTQDANRPHDSSDQRLTIQSGEGEKLNLPWFIRDTQDWVNRK